jgi:site-specific DNA recombinase
MTSDSRYALVTGSSRRIGQAIDLSLAGRGTNVAVHHLEHKEAAQEYDYYVYRAKGEPTNSRRDEPCPARYAPTHQIDELLWEDLCALLAASGRIIQARREQLRQSHLGIDRQLERLTGAYLLGAIALSEYQRQQWAMEEKADQLETQMDCQA